MEEVTAFLRNVKPTHARPEYNVPYTKQYVKNLQDPCEEGYDELGNKLEDGIDKPDPCVCTHRGVKVEINESTPVVTIPYEWDYVPFAAFKDCDPIDFVLKFDERIFIGDIGEDAFMQSGVIEIVWNNAIVPKIHTQAFVHTKLQHVEIPYGTQDLGKTVFLLCEHLRSAYISETV